MVEDASSAVQESKVGALGVVRLNYNTLLNKAGADLLVTSLDEVAVNALSEARLDRETIR
jgi:hypothetical protein